MTWPFENDTSAIVKKLAGRSMQADKRNKAFLLLTIAISVCMVFSILLISTGTQEKFKKKLFREVCRRKRMRLCSPRTTLIF